MTTNIFSPGPTPNTIRSPDGKVHTAPNGWVLLPPGDAALIPTNKGKRREVRRMVAQRSQELSGRYRRGEVVGEECPLSQAMLGLGQVGGDWTRTAMPKPTSERFDTARLSAEAISLEHFAEIHRLHTDPLVMKTLSADGNLMTEEAPRKHLQRCSDHWDQHDFGLWVFRPRSDGQFIGRAETAGHDVRRCDLL